MLCFTIFLIAVPLPAQKVYIGIRGAVEIMEVDIPTGDRRFILVERYPDIIATYQLVAESSSTLLFKTFTAAQFLGIYRLHPANGQYTGVSGYVDASSFDPRGSGPNFAPDLLWLGHGGPGRLFALRMPAALMGVDTDTGARMIISQPDDPPAGYGFPMTAAVDAVVESSTGVLVVDQFQGVIAIDTTDGGRTLRYPNTAFLELPWRIERLPSGELVHCLGEQGSDTLFQFNPLDGSDAVLSSGSPARPRGAGPAFMNVVDITISNNGSIYAYDMNPPALFQVNAKTGDRAIVSGGPQNRGSGPELPDGFNRITLAAGWVEVKKSGEVHLVIR